MATPVKPMFPTAPKTVVVSNADVSAVATSLSYVVPANRVSKLIGATFVLTAGVAPTIALQVIISGVTVSIESGTIQTQQTEPIWLQAADTVRWRVTAGGAGGTADLSLTVEEYEAQ